MAESSECDHEGDPKACRVCHEQVCTECSYECASQCNVCKWCWMAQYYEVEGPVCTACYNTWYEKVFLFAQDDSSSE